MDPEEIKNPCKNCRFLEVDGDFHFCSKHRKGVNVESIDAYGPILLKCQGEPCK